jgi:mono/diheme cytochrome c family protein
MTGRRISWFAGAAALLFACDEGKLPPFQGVDLPCPGCSVQDAGSPAVDAAPSPAPVADCREIQAEPVPLRTSVRGETVSLLAASELFDNFFVKQCGACHAGMAAMGNFQLNELTFPDQVERCLEYMRKDDPALVMPKAGALLKDRSENDPVREMERVLDAWVVAGKPEVFPDPRAALPADAPTADAPGGLAVGTALGKALTNMGSCVPAARVLYSEQTAMDSLDETFANAEVLPAKLSETDLSTLDSLELAKRGVISYAPAYTLWADDAKKMRYIRVPRGTSVKFDVATQSFDIPDNTRFYKTFLKRVIDRNGQEGYKKIETRVIVVRRGAVQGIGEYQPRSLFGTYVWNESETEAELLQVALRNGKPFADLDSWYVTDEVMAQPVIDTYEGGSEEEKLLKAKSELIGRGFARHYGVPGSERCVQCHRGSPGDTFVLAFNPLQIVRRPEGEGGVIEPAGPDELNQLQRFIDYGLITGVASPSKIVPLEKSQGAREPRNNYELVAQGYMLGNCAHCHNPNGYASVSAPALKDVLDFYPTASKGGIFEFPLARTSPRIFRSFEDPLVDGSMPYITPSVYDRPMAKQPSFFEDPELAASYQAQFAAPWRSLIYRNTEAPFTYAGDGAIYPHMPLNTPGFDCRAPKIMAEWMVSIPARRKTGDYLDDSRDPVVQPFVEVKRGDADYDRASLFAEMRLQQYHASDRYNSCPDTSDVVDPSVDGVSKLVPEPSQAPLNIPSRPHWVPLDLTDKVTDSWEPRNGGWREFLVDKQTPNRAPTPECDAVCQTTLAEDQARLVNVLDDVKLTPEFLAFARSEVPFGFWQSKPGCDFAAVPKAKEFVGRAELPWIDPKQPEQPVYMQAPGAAVFTMICANCHGADADSRGRQSDSLLLLTGGSTRVANFRTGLFGPASQPGKGRGDVFGPVATPQLTSDDWGARYLAWMALGGTTRTIPDAILRVVGANPVLGVRVERGVVASANMLGVARAVCRQLLPSTSSISPQIKWSDGSYTLPLPSAVIQDNGDAWLWKKLCSFDNALPVRVMTSSNWAAPGANAPLVKNSLYRRAGYPAGAPVVDQNGFVAPTLTPANQEPWCLLRPTSASELKTAEELRQRYASAGTPIPFCPDALFARDTLGVELHRLTVEDELAWELRGAVNAGLSVFTYLDDLTKGLVKRKPEFNQCEQLATSSN